MNTSTALQEIDDLINSEKYKNLNLKSYLKKEFSEKGSITQNEFELIEKSVKLFLQSIKDSEIIGLWKNNNDERKLIDFNKYEPEINCTKNELETELIDLYINEF